MADISITAANVLKSSTGQVSVGTAGATITAGQAVYIDTGDSNKIKLADADGTSPAFTLAGIALNAASSGQPVSFCTNDTAGFTIGATVAAGDVIWLSPNPGGLTKTFADLLTTDKVVVIGVMLTTTTMNLTPIQGGAVL